MGPPEVLAAVRPGSEGQPIRSPEDVAAWLARSSEEEQAEPFTFVVDLSSTLRIAPRRSEHVACAGGAPVLSAGEITFLHDAHGWVVSEISNHSTGYCPAPASWPAVGDALDRAGLRHPGQFTGPVTFRRCPHCHERNLVKDDDFTCAVCATDLPLTWNFVRLEDQG